MTTPEKLRSQVVKGGGLTVGAISFASALLSFREIVDITTVVVGAALLFGVSGWLMAFLVLRGVKTVSSPTEQLLARVSEVIQVPFLESWLSATVLNRRAIESYRNASSSIRVSSIICRSVVQRRNIRNVITIAGKNESRQPVDGCPMLLFGGAVINPEHLSLNRATLTEGVGGGPMLVRQETKLNLGQLVHLNMVFPTLIPRGGEFVVTHEHEWPGAMTPGLDVMWYPYAVMFSRDVDRLEIAIEFEEPVTYVRGYVAHLDASSCTLAANQPTTADGGLSFAWAHDDVEADALFALVFDLAEAPAKSSAQEHVAPEVAET